MTSICPVCCPKELKTLVTNTNVCICICNSCKADIRQRNTLWNTKIYPKTTNNKNINNSSYGIINDYSSRDFYNLSTRDSYNLSTRVVRRDIT